MNSHNVTKLETVALAGASIPPWAEVFARRLRALLPLQEHEVAAIAALIREPLQVPASHQIHEDGKPAREAFVLLRGLACHYRLLDSARRQMTGFVTPGDFCDHGFLSSSPVRQCVMTLGPAIIGRIDLGQFSVLANRMPTIVLAIMRAASVEQATARELIISLGARDALQRLAHLLCELHARLQIVGQVSPAGQFDLALTQAELGEALGLSTVHVNRTIQQLRKQNLISMAHGHVTILNFQGLADVAAFAPHYLKPN